MNGGADDFNPDLNLKAQRQNTDVTGHPREGGCPSWNPESSLFHHLFVLFRHSRDWKNAHLHWGRQSALLNSWIQMLISSRNALIDKTKNSILPAIWVSLSLVKLIHKTNHHVNIHVSYWFCFSGEFWLHKQSKKKKKKVGERDKTIPKKEKYTLSAKILKKES